MRALLLAAGLGTRLRPITNTIPKCLVLIRGKPLLGYWLDLLLGSGDIERVLVNLHYFPEAVREFLVSSRWREQIDLVYEETLLGTGGTVLANAGYFSRKPFMVIHVDNLSQFDVRSFIDCHAKRPMGCAITMMTFVTDQPQNCGIVELDAKGVVKAFHEKVADPPGSLANGAVYIFDAEVVDFSRSLCKRVIDISTEVLPKFIGRIFTFLNDSYHRDIGTPASLQAAEREYPRHPAA
jgi:mannose-1-phosphate guanylyltransferase